MKITELMESITRLGPDKNDPYEQGWSAGHIGDFDCPYEMGTSEYKQWQAGFEEAGAQSGHYDESVEQNVAEAELDEACWKGYHKEGNKKMFGKTYPNCVKNESVTEEHENCPECGGAMYSEEMINEKKDACYYKVKSRYKVWPSAYASGALVKCRKSGASNWGTGGKKNESIDEDQLDEKWSKKYKDSINCSNPKGFSQKAHCDGKQKNEDQELDENLHKWFKEKWVRFGPDGKIRGDCAKGDDSEGKPKCLPQSKAHSLGKKGRASAASRKRREDPNSERSGKAINVNTKKKSNEDVTEGNDFSNIHFPRVDDEIILKNPNYRGVIVKLGTDGDFSFKNESDGKRYRANKVMIDRNLSQEKRYKSISDVENKRFADAMARDQERIYRSGALKKFGIGETSNYGDLDEVAPPGQEDWIKSNKDRFKKEYGDKKGEQVLYATAWKRSKGKK